MTATRRRRQKPTSWSIIEENSALYHNLLSCRDTRLESHDCPLVELRLDRATLEGPRRRCNKHRGPIVVHEKCRGGQQHAGLLRPREGDCREHVRFQSVVRI